MRREKRIIPLCLCALVLFCIIINPVFADSYLYYYFNGVKLPALPSYNKSTYPYACIVQLTSESGTWDYELIVYSHPGVVSDTLWWDGLSNYLIVPSGTVYRQSWILRDGSGDWTAFMDETAESSGGYILTPVSLSSGSYPLIWTNYDLYYESGTLAFEASDPVPYTGIQYPLPPVVTSSFAPNRIYNYALGDSAVPLDITATQPEGALLSYQWQRMSGTNWINIEGATTSQFVPPTNTLGTVRYRCHVTAVLNGSTSYANSNSCYVVVGNAASGGSGEVDDISPGQQVIIDQISGIQDALNPTSPGLDTSIGELEDSSGTVDRFEDEQWNSINDNIGDVTGAFDAFKDGSLAAAFGFLGGIVNNTFDSLGHWQVVITLPLALGLILYICSRSPLNSVPRIRDQAAAEVEAVKRADMRQADAAYRNSYEYYRENRGRKESYSARYNAEMGRKKK